jgi:hypothetical protein
MLFGLTKIPSAAKPHIMSGTPVFVKIGRKGKLLNLLSATNIIKIC